MFYVMS